MMSDEQSIASRTIKKIIRAGIPHGLLVLYQKYIDKSPSNPYRIADIEKARANKIAFVAGFKFDGNKYVDLIKRAIRKTNYTVVDNPDDAGYIWLHWYENNIDSNNFSKKVAQVKKWQKEGRKVILHIHNKKPHEHSDSVLTNTFMATFVQVVNHVSIISSETLNTLRDVWHFGDDFKNVSVVPHPNYIGVYGSKIDRDPLLADDTLNILFFGLVRPYKGLEHLIAATKELKNIKIGIYGRAPSDEYRAEVEALCKNRKDISLEIRHVEDEEIPRLFSQYHIVATPYSLDSSLNSGAAILAFSYGRTVIGTNNGTLKDINGDFYFTYDYKNEPDHTRQLKKAITAIQEKYRGRYNQVLQLGDVGYQYVKKHNNTEEVASAIETMFRRVH